MNIYGKAMENSKHEAHDKVVPVFLATQVSQGAALAPKSIGAKLN